MTATKKSSRSRSTSSSKSSSKSKSSGARKTPPKDDPAAPVVGSFSGRTRAQDVNRLNDPRNLPDEHRPHDDGDKPKDDVETALQVLRDGIHPGTPFGYVTKDDSHRDQYGVPQINEAAAKKLVSLNLASVHESKIRLAG